MSNVIIIPVFHRTAYLQTCLTNLSKARGIEDKHVWIFQSNNAEWDVDLAPVQTLVQDLMPLFKHVRFITRERHDGFTRMPHIHPSMFSTHAALVEAMAWGAQKTYYLESDVVVTPDFFEWHDLAQASGDWTATSAWREPQGAIHPPDIEAIYQTKVPSDPTAYGDIVHGLCFNLKALEKVTQHLDWWNHKWIIEEDWRCVRPYVQRCFHLGHISEQHMAGSGPENGYPSAVDRMPDPVPDYHTSRVTLI